MIVSDNGPDVTSSAIVASCSEHRIGWHCIAQDEAMQNGYIRSSNGCMYDGLLKKCLFFGSDHACRLVMSWVLTPTPWGCTGRSVACREVQNHAL
jgi:transposase InsO family protein